MRFRNLLCLLTVLVLMFCACGEITEQPGTTVPQATTEPVKLTTAPTSEPVESTTVPTTTPPETAPKPMGYTLEEIETSGRKGLFYILEDGSFARYNAGGFKYVLHEGFTSGVMGSALFINADAVDTNPVLAQDDTIAIFYDQSVSVELWPVGGIGATVSLRANDQDVILNPFGRYFNSSSVIKYPAITLDEHDETQINLINSSDEYLFGVPMEEITVTLYKNSSARDTTYKSFPRDTKMTITYVEGTKAIQEVKKANYHYYLYGNDYTNPDVPSVKCDALPTFDGYVAVSMENVPAGQYVMIVSTEDNRYYGTVVTVE